MAKQKVMTPEELRKMQLIQVDLLTEFDRVCRKSKIRYILDAGTLLGAVRYGKFIPWDDDIDVRMLRSDFEKFSKIAAKELDSSVFFQSNKTDKHYPWLYSKLRKEGTRAVRVGQENLKMKDGVFIDIFPCDGVPTNRILCKMRSGIATMCRKILYSRIAKDSAKTAGERLFWKAVSLIPKGVAYSIAGLMARLFHEENCERAGSMGWHAPKDNNGFQMKWFTELTDIEFEGKKFLAPKDWDGFLRYSFGDDYMTPPPVEKQGASSPLSYYDLGE